MEQPIFELLHQLLLLIRPVRPILEKLHLEVFWRGRECADNLWKQELQRFPVGWAKREALELLLPKVVSTLPTAPEHLEVQLFENWAYWANEEEELVEQFEDWLLHPQAS